MSILVKEYSYKDDSDLIIENNDGAIPEDIIETVYHFIFELNRDSKVITKLLAKHGFAIKETLFLNRRKGMFKNVFIYPKNERFNFDDASKYLSLRVYSTNWELVD